MFRIGICGSHINEHCDFESIIRRVVEEPTEIHAFPDTGELEDYYKNKGQFDIILMEVEQKEQEKIRLIKKIQDMYSNTKAIFTSEDPAIAEDIFEAEPSAFLIEPIKPDKLIAAFTQVICEIKKDDNSYATFTTRNKVIRIKSNDIYYVESDRRLLYIYGKSIKQKIYGKLDDFLQSAAPVFLRTHKSYAVNMNWIKSFSADGVELYDGRKVPVSRPKYKNAREAFIEFCGGG